MSLVRLVLTFVIFAGTFSAICPAQTASEVDGWLRYQRLDTQAAKQYEWLPSRTVLSQQSPVLQTAQQELNRGLEKMLGRGNASTNKVKGPSIVLGTIPYLEQTEKLNLPKGLSAGDGYWITRIRMGGADCLLMRVIQ